MTRIAFATYAAKPGVTADDLLVARALVEHGVEVDGIPWDAPIEWDRYALVLPRSTWDFHHRLPEFRDWLARLTAADVPTLNPACLLEWSLTKEYLRALERFDIDVVPTLWATGDSAAGTSLADVLTGAGWNGTVVVKPVVSASAHGTWVAHRRDRAADEQRFRASLTAERHGLMLQPFLPEVQSEGEWSLVFLGGQFSHAVLKQPAEGDFRVQEEHGGRTLSRRPDAHVIDAAGRALHAASVSTGLAPDEILYARVDGVVHDGRFLLMELEAIEPFLFLATAPEAAGRMASLIHSALLRAPEEPG